MRKLLLLFAALVVIAGCRRTPVQVKTQLMRLDAPWMYPSPDTGRRIRTAPATIIVFRDRAEYVELHCWLIEQPDETLYVASRNPRVVAVGTWKQSGEKVKVTRTRIARTRPLPGPVDPLCAEGPFTLRVSGNSVAGNAGGTGEGTYAPVTRLVAPDFESYVDEANRSPVTCVKEKD